MRHSSPRAAFWIVTSVVTGMFNLAIYVFALVLSAGDNLLYIILQAIVIVVVGSFTGLYTWMVSSRLMGLFFRQAQRNLGWFRPID